MQTQNNPQIVNINIDKAPCVVCGSNLVDVNNFSFKEKGDIKATYFEEQCLCKNCHTPFVLHYDIFDEDGHILSRVFVEDINDETYDWQDPLEPTQKEAICKHLENCPTCLDRLSQEMLTDAWLKSFITDLRTTRK